MKALQQQLTQIKNLKEAQLNKLIEKLNNHKVRLPLEDHSIIDWAVSAIRIRIQQKEELMDEITENLNNITAEFKEKCEKNSNPQAVYNSFTNSVVRVIDTGSHIEYNEGTKKAINKLKSDLKECFLNDKFSHDNILNNSSVFCKEKANEIQERIKENKIDKSAITSAEKLGKHYELAFNDLSIHNWSND